MRVITGLARGKNLVTLPGDDTRPTASRVKEGLFSAIQFDLEGRRVLDLFAGSGQLGIEALSRGAEHAVFIDSSAEANAVIIQNLKATGLFAKASVSRTDYASFLRMTRDTFDIAFVDPPYYAGFYEEALSGVVSHMSDYGLIVCEHPEDVALPAERDGFAVYREYSYGKIRITIYKKSGKTDET